MSEQKNYNEMSDSEKKKEDWMNSKWRPAMGWLYMLVCLCDFVVFPVLWSMLQAIAKVGQITQWNPLTLQGAGLFHLAMGAVLGLAAWGRTQEKLGGANNGGLQSGVPSTQPTGFGAPAQNTGFGGGGFGGAPVPSQAAGFGNSAGFGSQPIATTASGKKIVPMGEDPVL